MTGGAAAFGVSAGSGVFGAVGVTAAARFFTAFLGADSVSVNL